MASSDPLPTPERLNELERRISSAYDGESASWKSSGDLARMGVEALLAETAIARTLPSAGRIRLSGEGAQGSAAPAARVARIIQSLQRTATAFGAATEGQNRLEGTVSVDIQRRTELLLTASPGVGSLILDVVPATTPADEVRDASGLVELTRQAEDDDQLVDRSMETLIEVLVDGLALTPDLRSPDFDARLQDSGPRAASAIRDLSRALARYRFDMELGWSQPDRPTRAVRVTAASADRIARAVEAAHLDEQPLTISGTVLTLSTLDKQAWLIETADGTRVAVKHGAVPVDEIRGIGVDETVRIDAVVSVETTAGGAVKTTYTARHIVRARSASQSDTRAPDDDEDGGYTNSSH